MFNREYESSSVPETIEVTTVVPNVGDGNPAAARAVAYELSRIPGFEVNSNQLGISAQIPAWFHRVMSSKPELSSRYTQGSAAVRSGIAGVMAGALMGGETYARLRSRRKENTDSYRVLAVVQEMILIGLPEQILQQYHRVFLFVPDVVGKLPIPMPDDQRSLWNQVTVVVWNTLAQTQLVEAGYQVELVQPWMHSPIPELIKDPIFEQPARHNPTIFVKPSGSGWPKRWKQALLSVFKETNSHFVLYDRSGKIVTESETRESMVDRSFYFDINWHPPEALIGYSSEVIQILAAQALQTEPIRFFALPPRGQHEWTNLRWAIQQGLCQGLIFPEGYDAALPKSLNQFGDTASLTSPELVLITPTIQEAVNNDSDFASLVLALSGHIPLAVALTQYPQQRTATVPLFFDSKHTTQPQDLETVVGSASIESIMRDYSSGTISE